MVFYTAKFCKCKKELHGACHPPSKNDEHYFDYLDKVLETYSINLLLKISITEYFIESFLYENELSSLVKKKTRFKNKLSPSCIDFLLNNNSYAIQQTTTVCSGLLDFHALIVLKTTIPKSDPTQSTYINYKKYDSLKFKDELQNVGTKKMLTTAQSLTTNFWKF